MFDTAVSSATLVELLRRRAEMQPERRAYTFWNETEEVHFTYSELDRKARALGALLQSRGAAGERALLLYPPGPEYLVAFMGCLYAGAVAVPAYPPRQNGNLGRLQAVIADSEAAFALTTAAIQAGVERRGELGSLTWLATDATAVADELAELWQEPDVSGETIAFLQYTSGSTSTPKGVVLSHCNLLKNLNLIESNFRTKPESQGVVWLPPYHDMGLIGGILQPLYTGYPMVLMPPVSFIQKPLLWLQAITRYGATVSGGPNFAYDLCVQKITPEQRDALDLSTWENAFCGAEPIRQETLDRFAAYFAPCGFRKEAFYACYGLAESTLFVTGGQAGEAPVELTVDSEALTRHVAVPSGEGITLVSSGKLQDAALVRRSAVPESSASLEVAGTFGQPAGFESNALSGKAEAFGPHVEFGFAALPAGVDPLVRIVDPQTAMPCADGQVGEIWIAGSSIAQGYWKRPEQTEETFRARLAEGGEGPFLRTGDLGFALDGELYVTGRLKDLLIIRGRNHYPQDIEATVQSAHPALRKDAGAAFAIEADGEERLVIVQEIERTHRKANLEEVVAAVRRAVSESHELQAHAVVLIKTASIPKTSSGKIQRHACKARFTEGSLDVVHADVFASSEEVAVGVIEAVDRETLLAEEADKRQDLLERHLLQEAAEVLNVPLARVLPDQSLAALGLDSMMAVELKNRMEESFGIALSMADLLEGPTVRALASQVLEQLDQEPSAMTRTDAAPETNALSYGQRALWFIQRLSPENTAYNIAKAVRIRGEFDAERMKQAFAALMQRHEILRTAFVMENGEPVRKVLEAAEVPFFEGRGENLPFDLEKAPLFRVHVETVSEQEHVLQLTMHHIITDFWSLGVLMRELRDLYVGAELPAPVNAYGEYVQHQLANQTRDELWHYWQGQLEGQVPVLNLPADRKRPPVQTYNGATRSLRLDADLTQTVKALAKAEGATLYMTLLAAFQVLLHRYTGQDDIWVGSPTAGRSSARYADVLGYFINPVVLRAKVASHQSFRDFLADVRGTVLGALQHQDFPFPLLVERLQPKRDLSYPPLFQAMFTLQKSHMPGEDGLTALALNEGGAVIGGALPLETVAVEQNVAQFDLSLSVAEQAGELVALFEYNTDLFDDATIERMTGHFQTLLAGIADAPDMAVGELPLLTAPERQLLLFDWALGDAGDIPTALLHERLEEQAARTPDQPAVVWNGRQLTYRELNRQANQLARHLQRNGVAPGTVVGICSERCIEMITAIVAVWKAGAAYAPLDPAHPQERLAFMLEDTQAPVLLTQSHLADRFPAVTTICIDRFTSEESDANLPIERTEDQLAYLLYTSGTTGQPKGVACTHRGVLNLLADIERRRPLQAGEPSAWYTSFGFDVSAYEIAASLVSGSTLYPVPDEVRYNSFPYFNWLSEHGIRHCYIPPFMLKDFNRWLDEHPNELDLNRLIVGVEPIPEPLLAELATKRPRMHIVNAYGPSETTIMSLIYSVEGPGTAPDRNTPIGKPVSNMCAYVLDANQQPVPVGVHGEVYIGGTALSTGYFGRPELTASKYILHPEFGRVYRTGDLVRWLPDGNVEFLGRVDHQVKIRGFRIEPNEISAVLEAHPSIRECLVMAREDVPGDKRLAAYLTYFPGKEISTRDLRAYLAEKLPDYMIPSAFVILPTLPLNPNGKVDRKALPVPQATRDDLDTAYVAPANEAEQMLTRIWQEVLQVERVGVHDNFFDLGGHSLLMATVHERVQAELGRSFSIVKLFQHPTVHAFADYLSEGDSHLRAFADVRDDADKKRSAYNRQKQLRKDRRK